MQALASCLRVLDLSCNSLSSLQEVLVALQPLTCLEHLALVGNPLCTDPNYKDMVKEMLPNLQTLDGDPVSSALVTDKATAEQPSADVVVAADAEAAPASASGEILSPEEPISEGAVEHVEQEVGDETLNDPELDVSAHDESMHTQESTSSHSNVVHAKDPPSGFVPATTVQAIPDHQQQDAPPCTEATGQVTADEAMPSSTEIQSVAEQQQPVQPAEPAHVSTLAMHDSQGGATYVSALNENVGSPVALVDSSMIPSLLYREEDAEGLNSNETVQEIDSHAPNEADQHASATEATIDTGDTEEPLEVAADDNISLQEKLLALHEFLDKAEAPEERQAEIAAVHVSEPWGAGKEDVATDSHSPIESLDAAKGTDATTTTDQGSQHLEQMNYWLRIRLNAMEALVEMQENELTRAKVEATTAQSPEGFSENDFDSI